MKEFPEVDAFTSKEKIGDDISLGIVVVLARVVDVKTCYL